MQSVKQCLDRKSLTLSKMPKPKPLTKREAEIILDLQKRRILKSAEITISTEDASQHRDLELAASKITRNSFCRNTLITLT